VHACEPEDVVRAHIAYVLHDPSGVIPVHLLEAMVEPLFSSAVSDGLFAKCQWHRGHFTTRT
jgi:hypothetical protein